ncbi:MAG: YceI family protein [Myxococcales bacterium]|nr:YceI family protein [Myxococcales bacterium]
MKCRHLAFRRLGWQVGIALALLHGFGSSAVAVEVVRFRPETATSKIDVDVSATVGSFVGQVEVFQAEFWIPRGETGPASGTLSFDFRDLETHEKRRNEHMLRWLDYETNPKAIFTLEELAREAEQWIAVGFLEAAGVKRPVRVPVDISFEEERVAVDGRLTVDHRDWGLEMIRLLFVLTVEPEFDIIFHLEGPIESSVAPERRR